MCSFQLVGFSKSTSCFLSSVYPMKSVLQAAGRFIPLKKSSHHLSHLIKSLPWFSFLHVLHSCLPALSSSVWILVPLLYFLASQVCLHSFLGSLSLPAPFLHIFTKCLLGLDPVGKVYAWFIFESYPQSLARYLTHNYSSSRNCLLDEGATLSPHYPHTKWVGL